jgi:hypothetical protein
MHSYTNGFRREITDFISVSEWLQGVLARGEALSRDETEVVRLCVSELLERLPEQP